MLSTCKKSTRTKSRFLSGKRTVLTFLLLFFSITSGMAQTSYTWDGSTDTDFATADNWTPSGVPGSGDNITIVSTSNDPVLDATRTVNDLTMTSGTLKLATYTITVSNSGIFNGGNMQNGKLTMTAGTAKFNGTTMDCEVDVNASITDIDNTDFKKRTTLTSSYGSQLFSGGNIYRDTTVITRTAGSYMYIGKVNPDTFLAPLTMNLENAGIILMGHTATGNYFADDVTLNNRSGNVSKGFNIGYYAAGSLHFAGDIILNVDSTSGLIKFGPAPTTHDGQLLIGSEGYHSGKLTLKNYTQTGTDALDLSAMDHNATLDLGDLTLKGDLTGPTVDTYILTGCVFKGTVTLPGVRAWAGARFEKKTVLTVTSTGQVTTGGNMFLDTAIINHDGPSYLYLGKTVPDTFLAPLTYNLRSADIALIGHSVTGNYFADDVTLNNHSGNINRDIRIGHYATGSLHFAGDIIVNVDSTSGNIDFRTGATTHDGILRIGSEGYHSRQLILDNYTQTTGGTIDLTGMDNTSSLSVKSGADITANFLFGGGNTATLNGATFRGDVNVVTSSMPVTNCTFYGTTRLEKTGSVHNLNSGNMFRGNTTIENSSSGNYVYWGNSVPDTFLNALTLINRSSQALWMNYTSTGQYGGDITLDGDSLSVIRFGSSTAGRVAVFNGSTDQYINVLEPDLDMQIHRVEINKPSGRLKVGGDGIINYELKLTDGILECQNGAVITLADGVAPVASNSSYIEGAVKKIGNDAFTFPVGSNGHYRPIGISAPTNTTDAYTAQHRNEDSNTTYTHSSKDSTINEISTNEYWLLDRTAGTSDITVTLSWDDMSCNFDTLANLRMAAWKDTIWKDLGNGGTTGDSLVGTMNSNGNSTVYGAYALATVDTFDCVPCRVYAGEDQGSTRGWRVKIGEEPSFGTAYLWTPTDYLDDETLANPTATPTETVYYVVEATNSQGCVATDDVTIYVRRIPPPLPPCMMPY